MKSLRDHQPRITTTRTACRVQCQCGHDTGLVRVHKGNSMDVARRFYINHMKGNA